MFALYDTNTHTHPHTPAHLLHSSKSHTTDFTDYHISFGTYLIWSNLVNKILFDRSSWCCLLLCCDCLSQVMVIERPCPTRELNHDCTVVNTHTHTQKALAGNFLCRVCMFSSCFLQVQQYSPSSKHSRKVNCLVSALDQGTSVTDVYAGPKCSTTENRNNW